MLRMQDLSATVHKIVKNIRKPRLIFHIFICDLIDFSHYDPFLKYSIVHCSSQLSLSCIKKMRLTSTLTDHQLLIPCCLQPGHGIPKQRGCSHYIYACFSNYHFHQSLSMDFYKFHNILPFFVEIP